MLKMPDTPEQLLNLAFDENSAEAIEFYHAYGWALSAWARIETNFAYQFHSIINGDVDVALSIFYSARSFGGRTDMLYAALEKSRVSDNFGTNLKALIKKAVSYNSFRNVIVHGQPALHWWPAQPQKNRMVLCQGKLQEPEVWSALISVEQLSIAARNFASLARLVFRASDRQEEISSQLCTLPTKAYLKAEDST
jgi:hypothetical protein